MKEAALKQSESKKIIIATYAMASEGLDIKTLTSLILASPKTDVCQSVGRILRVKHSSPLVIDVIDAHDIFMSQWYKRRKYYKSQNYKILVCDNAEYDAGYNKDISKWKISWEPKSKDASKSVSKKINNKDINKTNQIQNVALQLNIATSVSHIKENQEEEDEDDEKEHEKKRNETRGKLGLSGKGCLIDMSIFN
jgi:superfamily II DNA or RNA helicase